MGIFTSLRLEKEPFSTSPDPAFFYKSKQHYTALNRLEIAIRLKRGLSLILGGVGTGKTTLSRALLHSFNGDEGQYHFHMIIDPSFKTDNQFLSHLAKLFGVNPYFRSSVDYRDVIEKYLYQKCIEENKTVVLMIDEGQKLAESHIEILRTLLNYETNENKMLQLVIFAQMELLPKIKNIKNFIDRASLKFILNPLDHYETSQLIEFRLKQAGYSLEKSLFTKESIRKIYEYTLGYPRQISLLCHQSIERLIMEDMETVTAELVDDIVHQDQIWKM